MPNNKLEVSLELIDKLTSPLNKASAEVSRFTKGLEGAFKFLGTAGVVTGAVAGITALINKSIEYGDKIDDQSEKLKMSAEQYQRLDYLLQNNGSSVQELSGALQTLNSQSYACFIGNQKAEKSFKALGISVKDNYGNLKDQNTLFNETLIKLAGLKNSTEQNALAQKIFGSAAANLVPLLSKGADGIQAEIEKAQVFNGIISNETAAKMGQAKDAMDHFNRSMSALTTELTSMFVPAITGGTEALSGFLGGLNKFFRGESQDNSEYAKKQEELNNINSRIKEITANLELANKGQKQFASFDLNAGGFKVINSPDAMKKELADLEARKKELTSSSTVTTTKTGEPKSLLSNVDKQYLSLTSSWGENQAKEYYDATQKMGAAITEWGEKEAKEYYDATQKMGAAITEWGEKEAKAEWDKQQAILETQKLLDDQRLSNIQNSYQKELALLDQKNAEYQQKYKGNTEALANINTWFIDEKKKIDQEEKYLQLDKMQGYMDFGSAVSGSISKMVNISNNATTARMNKMMAEGKLSEEQQNKYREQMKRRQTILAAISIAESAATAVMAVSKAWSSQDTGGFWTKLGASIVAVTSVIAETAGQIAAIKSASFASGTQGTRYTGLAVVGEQGRELVSLNNASVYNAHQTRQMMNQPQQTLHLTVYDNSGNVTREVERSIRSGEFNNALNMIKKKIA